MQGRVPQECGWIGHFQRGTLPAEAKFRPRIGVKELPTLTSKDSDDGWICGSLPVAMLAYRLEERRQILNDTQSRSVTRGTPANIARFSASDGIMIALQCRY